MTDNFNSAVSNVEAVIAALDKAGNIMQNCAVLRQLQKERTKILEIMDAVRKGPDDPKHMHVVMVNGIPLKFGFTQLCAGDIVKEAAEVRKEVIPAGWRYEECLLVSSEGAVFKRDDWVCFTEHRNFVISRGFNL